MSRFTDPTYLKAEQYRDSSNLDARVELHRRFSTNSYGWFPWIFDTLESLPSQARVLELGSGPGYMWKECMDRIPPGWSITLSDLSDGMVDAAWRNLVVTGRAFKFEQIDAQSIPYPDETFDIVIANFMLYHVPDRQKALQEIHRVLRSPDPVSGEDGGHFLAATSSQEHLKELNTWLQKASPDKYMPFNSLFSLDNGLEQLKSFFSTVEIKRYDNNLRVTEIEPLIAYIFSTTKARDIPESAILEICQELEDILSQKGEIFITTDSGLFLAVK
ncbi:MAG: methyltransferase domain-containing protein [Anaerolineales bacterium]|jgi:ubiquinone/menaquinone biosynthesis C-methylase UbiE